MAGRNSIFLAAQYATSIVQTRVRELARPFDTSFAVTLGGESEMRHLGNFTLHHLAPDGRVYRLSRLAGTPGSEPE
jgi:hypothetical protein